jgi:hypothetical protein
MEFYILFFPPSHFECNLRIASQIKDVASEAEEQSLTHPFF